MIFRFSVDTRPVSKARPRFANGHTYTPQKTLDYENLIAIHAKSAGAQRMPNPCIVDITCTFKKPKGKKDFYCTINRDLDNLSKAILDGLNNIAFLDDSQVVSLTCSKNYGKADRVDVEIEYLY